MLSLAFLAAVAASASPAVVESRGTGGLAIRLEIASACQARVDAQAVVESIAAADRLPAARHGAAGGGPDSGVAIRCDAAAGRPFAVAVSRTEDARGRIVTVSF